MNKSHKRFLRRDRRKAKASDWQRSGKTSMGARVGHGSVGAGHKSPIVVTLSRELLRQVACRTELDRLAREIGNGSLSTEKVPKVGLKDRRVKRQKFP